MRQRDGAVPTLDAGVHERAQPVRRARSRGRPDLFIKIDKFHETFCADLSDDVAGPMAVSQRPSQRLRSPRRQQPSGGGTFPWYLVSEHDNAIPPDCERFMAQRMNAVTESVDGSHVAFIAQPEVASGLILKALASI